MNGNGRTLVWKAYLVVWVAFRAFTLGTRLLFGGDLQSAAYFVLGGVGFVPLIAFVVEKPVLVPLIWRVWLFFLLGWAAFDPVFYAGWFLQPPFDHELVGLLLAVPGFAATYSYSRPTHRVWAGTI